jgi:hypothetical protein
MTPGLGFRSFSQMSPTPKGSSMFVATVVLTIVLAAVFLGAGIPKILGTKTSLRMRDQLQINPQLTLDGRSTPPNCYLVDDYQIVNM